MTNRRSIWALAISVFMVMPAISATQAQAAPEGWVATDNEEHGWDLSLMAAFHVPWFVGAGVTLGIPIMPAGFADGLNDSFYIEAELFAGANIGFLGSSPEIWTMAGVRYQVQLFDWLAVFAAVRAGIRATFWNTRAAGTASIAFAASGHVGVLFTFTDFLAVRVEGGYPGVRAGVTFMF